MTMSHGTEHKEPSLAHRRFESIVVGGVVAGLAAAITVIIARIAITLGVLIVFLYYTRSWHAYLTRAFRREFWVTLKVAAYPLVGERALEPGFDVRIVALGLASLLGISLVLGVLFALLARGRSRAVTYTLGILFGIATWIFDLLFINPAPGTAIEAIPAGLAMAYALLWYERRFPAPT
jgi:hypothetical protein